MMNRTTPDQEQAPASEPVWERPWSVEEIRRSSQSWSLAADAGLLQFLQEFSQQTISRTHEIKKQVDGLIRETKATDCRLHNVFNDFLMLSNTQFIENRVYDEEVEEPVLKAEAEKTEQVLVVCFQLKHLIVYSFHDVQDLYIDRPLPYLIGSKPFMEQEDVGLGELSSEEGSVGSDRGSIVDTEEEKEEEESDEDFANHSDNDQNRHTTQMSDEEEDDDGCDLFVDSEKEEEDIEDIEENTRPKRSRPTSFADELAARIKGDAVGRVDEEPTTLSSGEAKPRKTLKEKKERRTPSDDEEDNLFAPPKLTDEDFSPFGSRGGLFSGGKGLFDDEDEESDLFMEAPQDRPAGGSVKEESSSSKPGKKIPAGAVSVFLGDTDGFGAASHSITAPRSPEQPTPKEEALPPSPLSRNNITFYIYSSGEKNFLICEFYDRMFDLSVILCLGIFKGKVQSTANIFGDEEGDLFKEKAQALPEATVSQTDENKARAEKKVSRREELTQEHKFATQCIRNVRKHSPTDEYPSNGAKRLLEGCVTQDNLFGGTAAKKQTLSLQAQRQEKAKPSELSKKKASALLFSSDEEDQWNIPASQTHSASDSRSKGEPRDSGTLQGQEAKAVKKTSLFEEDEEDDLFAIAKDSQKKTQRVSLLFEDDVDSGGSLFGSPPTSVPPATTKKETVSKAPPLLFSDEEEKEAPLGVKPVDKKVESAKESLEFGRTDVAESEKEGLLTRSAQEAVKRSDLFSSSSPLDKGTKARTKTVLSLFDEEEDKMEDQNTIQAPQKEVGKGRDPDTRPKSTGVFQDEELLFSHKLQKDNDPDVDLFAGTKKPKLLEPSVGSLFGDDEVDDLFSSAKSQPLVQEKKRVVKKDHSVDSFKNQKHPESIQGSKEKGLWKPETPQANLAINPAALLPTAAPQISEVKPVLPELAFPSSEHRRSHGLESVPVLPRSGEAGVSFDLPAQADTLHSANKSRVKMRGKRRPQTRAARRLAAQESSEAQDISVPRGPIAQWADGAISANGHRPQLRAASGEDSTEEALAAAAAPWEGVPVPGVDRSPFAKSRGEADLFDSGDIFSTGTGSQSTERTKPKAKIAENSANLPVGGKAKSPVFPALGEASSDDDLFQSAKPKPAKKTNPFPLLEDEDDLFTDQKVKKNETKSSSQQDVISTTQDIFEDDIFATEAIKPSQKTREKEKTLESNLFDDNIDIFADLTVKPKEKSKKKVEAKSIFDDDMDDIFSSGIQAKTTKPKSRSAQAAPEPRSEHEVSNIFDDPLNAFGGQ
ncbi:PREDICTED: WASH complex subunit FAM21A-like [Cercocebus atys]|uniref:WASH complex subunit FAM21A-like n=1 Tax=Cercocebus atys TaxID=9531 RepID=UPI0005F52C3F|nr:PREDICTED: WASH complex subunit FAM21A-like [Cercocebus atys]